MKNLNPPLFKFFFLVSLIIGCYFVSIVDARTYEQLSHEDRDKPKKKKKSKHKHHEASQLPSSISSPSSSPSSIQSSLLPPTSLPSFSPSSSPSSPPSSSPSPLSSPLSSSSPSPSSPSSSPPSSPTFIASNVLDYGAIGDGKVDDTNAFRKTWEDACNAQGGNFLVPHGYKFLIGPIIFEGPCNSETNFLLDGTILAPKLPSDWGDDDEYPKWLKFEELSKLNLKGQGTFDGRGKHWWSCKEEGSCKRAPTAVSFNKCDNCSITGVKFVDSQQIHFEFLHSKHGLVDSITIRAPENSPNTDGIHLQKSSFIDVRNSFVETGDDCVSIVSGCHDIKVSNMYCGKGCHGISVGSLGKHGATAKVSNVDVKNCTLEDTTNGLRIKSWPGGQGYARDITYSDIKMKNVENPIIIDQHYCPHVQGECEDSATGVKVSNIVYDNIIGTSASEEAITFDCSEDVPCEGISLNNVQLRHKESEKRTTFQCVSAYGIATQLVEPPSCLD